MDLVREKSKLRIQMRAQQRADAQSRRSQFQHDQAIDRIKFSSTEAVHRLDFKHDVIMPALEKLEQQVTAGTVDVRELSEGNE